MQTIFILPESDDTTLCVRYSGMATAEDYALYHHNEIVRRAEKNGWLNMLICYDDEFVGWTPEGAEANFKSICQLASKPRRLAYVNAAERKMFMMKLAIEPLMKAEMRFFEKSEYATALAWVKGHD